VKYEYDALWVVSKTIRTHPPPSNVVQTKKNQQKKSILKKIDTSDKTGQFTQRVFIYYIIRVKLILPLIVT